MQGEIHHTAFSKAMEKAHSIPHADLVVILSKPDVNNRKNDQLWRRTCAKHGISTTPLGVAKDTSYHRAYYLEGQLKSARARIVELEKAISALKGNLARARLDLGRMG